MAKPAYFAGLALGQPSEFTAIAVVERTERGTGEMVSGSRLLTVIGRDTIQSVPELVERRQNHYDVRWLERLPLGTSYPAIVARVRELMGQAPLCRTVRLAVDSTVVGKPVLTMLREARLPLATTLSAVLITAGDVETSEGGYRRVPKRDLVGALQVLLQSGRLQGVKQLPEAQTLVRELSEFKLKVTTAPSDTYIAWREGQHDDLVFAVALATWLGEQPPFIFM